MRYILFSLSFLFLSACSFSSKTEEAQKTPSQKQVEKYDRNSWKTLLPSTCTSFFDGCNTCQKTKENGLALCTMKACMEYKKPRCLDKEKQELEKTEKESEEKIDYTGKTVEEARKIAEKNGVPFRVIRNNGEDFIVTADYVPGRINAIVESGKVVGYEVEGQEKEKASEYNQNSWKTLLPNTCTSFFDGCNTCRRMEGEDVTACTRKFCKKYQKPRCLDEEGGS